MLHLVLKKKFLNNEVHILPCMRYFFGGFYCEGLATCVLSIIRGRFSTRAKYCQVFAGVRRIVCINALGDVSAVAEFELLFHKMLETKNHVNYLTNNKPMGHLETSKQHSLHGSRGLQICLKFCKVFHLTSQQQQQQQQQRQQQQQQRNH